MTPDKKEVLPSFNLRLPDDVRQRIGAEARLAGRSMNAEITHRLRVSLEPRKRSNKAEESPGEYTVHTNTERAMLQLFRRLDHEKQLALLTLFK